MRRVLKKTQTLKGYAIASFFLRPCGCSLQICLFCLPRRWLGRYDDGMAQAIADPDELRRFAEELKRFNNDVQNSMASLNARFSALGDTWQDQEHMKFAEEYKDTMKMLRKFIETSNSQGPFLLRKAQRIEEYLKQR